jgi:arabinose-5-phosphate isomerase
VGKGDFLETGVFYVLAYTLHNMATVSKRNNAKTSKEARIKRVFEAATESLEKVSTTSQRAILKAGELIEASSGLIITTGVGKSGFIAGKCAATLTSLGRRSFTLNPTDALHGDVGAVGNSDVVIAFSYSGETAELLKTIRHIKKETRARIIAITGKEGSALAKLAHVAIITPIVAEGSTHELAPMASTTAALVVADALASSVIDPHIFTHKAFAKLHPAGSLGLQLERVQSVMKKGNNIPKVYEQASCKEALLELSKKKQGIVAIVSNTHKLLGVLTDGDIRRAVIRGVDMNTQGIKTMMTKTPKIISKEATLKEALVEMERDNKVTSLFVVNAKKEIEGIIHMHHIIGVVV